MIDLKEAYEKYNNGDHFSDDELISMINHHLLLITELKRFKNHRYNIVIDDLQRRLISLEMYQDARNRIKNEQRINLR